MLFQRFSVSNYPCLHAGSHEEYLFVCCALGLIPIIAFPCFQVEPCGLNVRNRILTVDPESNEVATPGTSQGSLKRIKCLTTPALYNKLRHLYLVTTSLK